MRHYHVVCKSIDYPYPDIVVVGEEKAYTRFVSLVQHTYDMMKFMGKMEGCPIVEWTPSKAIFKDGTIIQIKQCGKCCIELIEQELITNKRPPWFTPIRDVFYDEG